MQNTYIVTGTLTDDRTVALDERVSLDSTRVRVILEPVPAAKRPAGDVLDEIWAAQDAQGYVPRTRAEIDAELERERESWGE